MNAQPSFSDTRKTGAVEAAIDTFGMALMVATLFLVYYIVCGGVFIMHFGIAGTLQPGPLTAIGALATVYGSLKIGLYTGRLIARPAVALLKQRFLPN